MTCNRLAIKPVGALIVGHMVKLQRVFRVAMLLMKVYFILLYSTHGPSRCCNECVL